MTDSDSDPKNNLTFRVTQASESDASSASSTSSLRQTRSRSTASGSAPLLLPATDPVQQERTLRKLKQKETLDQLNEVMEAVKDQPVELRIPYNLQLSSSQIKQIHSWAEQNLRTPRKYDRIIPRGTFTNQNKYTGYFMYGPKGEIDYVQCKAKPLPVCAKFDKEPQLETQKKKTAKNYPGARGFSESECFSSEYSTAPPVEIPPRPTGSSRASIVEEDIHFTNNLIIY